MRRTVVRWTPLVLFGLLLACSLPDIPEPPEDAPSRVDPSVVPTLECPNPDERTTFPCVEWQPVIVANERLGIIYHPSAWSDAERATHHIDAVKTAAERALDVYRALPNGIVPPVDIYLTDIESADKYAETYQDRSIERRSLPCHVWIYEVPATGQRSSAEQKQILAHELFHCYQIRNYPFPMSSNERQWWSEGTAEYFSNLVYPGVNLEYRAAGMLYEEFLADTPRIHAQSPFLPLRPTPPFGYSNFLLFQYLEHEVGVEGILGLMNAMARPPRDSIGEHQQAFAGYSFRGTSMADAFHHYGQAFLDGTIRDSSGEVVWRDPPPHWYQRNVVTFGPRATSVTLTSEPTVVSVYNLSFDSNQRIELRVVSSGSGQFSVKPRAAVGQPAAWAPALPSLIACDDDSRNFAVLMTTTAPQAFTLQIQTQIRRCTEDEAEQAVVNPCLVGDWTLTSIQFHPKSSWPAKEFTITGGTGVQVRIDGSGKFTVNHQNTKELQIHFLKDTDYQYDISITPHGELIGQMTTDDTMMHLDDRPQVVNGSYAWRNTFITWPLGSPGTTPEMTVDTKGTTPLGQTPDFKDTASPEFWSYDMISHPLSPGYDIGKRSLDIKYACAAQRLEVYHGDEIVQIYTRP